MTNRVRETPELGTDGNLNVNNPHFHRSARGWLVLFRTSVGHVKITGQGLPKWGLVIECRKGESLIKFTFDADGSLPRVPRSLKSPAIRDSPTADREQTTDAHASIALEMRCRCLARPDGGVDRAYLFHVCGPPARTRTSQRWTRAFPFHIDIDHNKAIRNRMAVLWKSFEKSRPAVIKFWRQGKM